MSSVGIEWDKDLKLPNKDGIISKEEANKLYKENQDADLVYRLHNKDNKLEGSLMYSMKHKGLGIDAKEGKAIENINNMHDYIYYGFVYRDLKKTSSEEQTKLLDSKEIISKEEAKKSLRDFGDLDESYQILNADLMKSETDKSYVWNIEIHKQEGNSGYGTNLPVDAKNGEVLNFNKVYMSEEEEDAKYSEEQLLKKAQQFLKAKMPEKYKQVEYAGSMYYEYRENMKNYSFTFLREIEGVKVPQNGFSMNMSAVTGEVMDYNYAWSDIEFPSKENVIEKAKAKEILMSDKELELNYIIDKDSIKNKKKQVKLVYSLKEQEGIFINANTGKEIDLKEIYDIPDRDEKNKEYKDIEKSYAKEEIKKLKENRIFLPGENFLPKDEISQKDFLYLLSNTKGYINPYESEYIYMDLIRDGVIKNGEKKLDESITRLEAVKYVIRSFGQEESAKLGDIYKSNYKDINSIPSELRGYVAVAERLKVISGEGNFRANDKLTRQEAAMIIYNILNRD